MKNILAFVSFLLICFIPLNALGEQTQPVVTVQAKGSTPYQQLRYRIPDGTEQQMHVTMKMGVQIPGQLQLDTPPIKMSGNIRVKNLPNGDFKSFFNMNEYSLLPSSSPQTVVAAMQAEIDNLPSLTGWQITTSRGEVVKVGYDLESFTNQQMKNQSLGLYSVPSQLQVLPLFETLCA